MHELSLAQSLLEQLITLAEEHKAKQITRAVVLLGPFSGIVADSFSFGFSVLKENHEKTKSTELLLETPPPEYTCLDCKQHTTINHQPAPGALRNIPGAIDSKCIHCGSGRLSPSGGTELILKQLEME